MKTSSLDPKLIRASAGSGKTFELSSRYIQILAMGESPEHILATTFTRKAAAEIRHRVFMRLAQAVLSKEKAAAIGEALGRDSFSPSQAWTILRQFVDNQHRINISTLDSFFSKLALSFGFELGLPLDWRIADSAETARVFSEVVKSLLLSVSPEKLLPLLREFGSKEAQASVQANLERSIGALRDLYYESKPEAWDWLEEKMPCHKETVRELSRALELVEIPKNKDGSADKRWTTALLQLKQKVNEQAWEKLFDLSLVQNVLDQDFKFAGKEIDAAFQKTIQALIRQAGAHALLNLRARNRATWKLLKDCTQLYEKLLLEWHILGFSDVKQALSKSALLGNLEPLYYRLDLKLRHLLLDEFQDTAPAEWRIIEPVVAEILSKYSAEHSFFCVGDVKQAIYGWRGGVAEIFDSLEQKWPQIAVETREKTYRCSQPIIEAVNTIFGGLALNQALAEYPEAVKAWSAWFRPHTTNRVKDPAFVSVNVAAAEDLLAQSAQRIKVLLEQNPKLSVGVLVRRRESIPLVIAELTKIGVPASAEGASTLAESQAVQLILAIFRLMDHPADTISAYHLAVSALGPQMGLQAGPGWGDAASLQMLALKLRESVTLLGVGNFVEDWVLKLKACVSPAEWQRLEQLVALGFAFEQRLSSAFRRGVEFIDFVESTQLEAPLSVAVRVMTMHGSKGLEFDAVILPELDQDLFNLSLVEVLRYYEDRLKAPKLISLKPQKAVCQLDERLKSAQEQVATSVVKESLSLLYVALTRARRGLYLFCKQQAPSRKKEYAATFSGVVLAALKLDAESCGELYTQGHKDWANEVQDKGTAAPACGAAAQTLTKLSLKSSAGALRGLVRESPSKLYKAETKLGEVLILPGAGQGRELGILLHALFQKVEWLGDGALSDELLLGWLKGRPYGEKLKLRAISEFRQYIAQTEISSLLKPERYRPFGVAELKVKCELSFALRQQNSILSGYMDRVVLCGEGKGLKAAEIFDFKTDRLSSEKAFQDEKLERYKQQLGIYRQAASRLFGLDLKAIRCQLVFLSLGQIVEVPL